MAKRSAIEDVLPPRAVEVRRRFEIPVLIAALAVVPVIFIESTSSAPSLIQTAYWANWAIWAAFLVEYIAVMSVTDRRWAYTKRAWLDVLVIVVSFPALPAFLASTRLLRLTRLTRVLRLLRLLRLAAVMTRGSRAAGAIFRTRGIGYVAVITLLVALGIGGTFSILEGTPMMDGLWWSLVTVTTVGYGDMFPVTPGGRIAATFLMILGIGLVAYITAAVAAHFVENEDSELVGELRSLHDRLDRIEVALGTSVDRAVPIHTSGPSAGVEPSGQPADREGGD
jgi:voltage-gated potassium channel